MTYDDVAVLRELYGSVYLTPRQREALGRALARVVAGAPLPASEERTVVWAGVRIEDGLPRRVERLSDGTERSSAVEDEKTRRALLGVLGAE